MPATLLDGKALAATIQAGLAAAVAAQVARGGPKPGLAAVRVGDDPASEKYVRGKVRACERVGIASFMHHLSAATTTEQLLGLIAQLNDDPAVHGILVQLPLPKHIVTGDVLVAIDPAKDVDGFHPFNVGRLSSVAPGAPLDFPVPCTPLGVSMLLHDVLGELASKTRGK